MHRLCLFRDFRLFRFSSSFRLLAKSHEIENRYMKTPSAPQGKTPGSGNVFKNSTLAHDMNHGDVPTPSASRYHLTFRSFILQADGDVKVGEACAAPPRFRPKASFSAAGSPGERSRRIRARAI